MTRTTKAELDALVRVVEQEAKTVGVLAESDSLELHPGKPYRLTRARSHAFTPADGNGGDVGRTPREVEHTLRIMFHTLKAARVARQ